MLDSHYLIIRWDIDASGFIKRFVQYLNNIYYILYLAPRVLNKVFSAPLPTPKSEKCDLKTRKFFFKPEKDKHPFRNQKIKRFKPEIGLHDRKI